ncbi:hypothetical protein ACOME3_003184 [Neoechinorhynchus agilis]
MSQKEDMDNGMDLPDNLFSPSNPSEKDAEYSSADNEEDIPYETDSYRSPYTITANNKIEAIHFENQSSMYCKDCRHFIPNETVLIRCEGPCRSAYHLSCSGLTNIAVEALRAEANAAWFCDDCAEELEGQLWFRKDDFK